MRECRREGFELGDPATGQLTVDTLTTAIESGPISNPDGMTNQTEGGVMQGMSRAIFEEVKWNAGGGFISTAD